MYKNRPNSFIKYCKKCNNIIPVMLSRNNICDDCLINNTKSIQKINYNNKTNDG